MIVSIKIIEPRNPGEDERVVIEKGGEFLIELEPEKGRWIWEKAVCMERVSRAALYAYLTGVIDGYRSESDLCLITHQENGANS